MRRLGLLCIFALVGCQSSAPTQAVDTHAAAKAELQAKIKGMSPAERKAYLMSHPDEVRKALTFDEPAKPAPK